MAAVAVLLLRDGTFEAPTGRDDDAPRTQPALAAALLADLESAIGSGDADSAADLAAADDVAAQAWLRGVVENARALAVEAFSLRYVDETATDGPGWGAAAEVTWQFAGFDASLSGAEVTFVLDSDSDGVVLRGVGGAGGVTPLWLTGPLEVRRGPRTLVLADASADDADRYDRLARRAVPIVRRLLPQWETGLVVEVPGSAAGLDAALGAPEGRHAQIAAVTAPSDGSRRLNAPLHVFINPAVFAGLEAEGAQVVMSHEAAHVATVAPFSRVPVWLLEGFADYVALRDVDLPLEVTTAQVAEQVRADGVPDDLPGPDEFSPSTPHLGAAYEAAWQVCVALVERGGEAALLTYYEQVSDGEDADAALIEIFGITRAELIADWQQRLRDLA